MIWLAIAILAGIAIFAEWCDRAPSAFEHD